MLVAWRGKGYYGRHHKSTKIAVLPTTTIIETQKTFFSLLTQKRRHINGKQQRFLVLFQVLGVNQITTFDDMRKLLAERIERLVGVVARRFHLNGMKLGSAREQEVKLLCAIYGKIPKCFRLIYPKIPKCFGPNYPIIRNSLAFWRKTKLLTFDSSNL